MFESLVYCLCFVISQANIICGKGLRSGRHGMSLKKATLVEVNDDNSQQIELEKGNICVLVSFNVYLLLN